ncbi:hypothetical protein DVS28_b0542 (plasmid) [Euzebya pacifica]|uniref:Metallopeptidase domain-containing protein n=1 Tax=Euzebya pacifica TaxID=1608957 RepID=A0A346Y735_9ACTN|nr:VWA-like domain-containing protein [Euzebya pacifica]AXV10282.1 hypothetical protein DVS28_b0542 [Euzebya pacifica]
MGVLVDHQTLRAPTEAEDWIYRIASMLAVQRMPYLASIVYNLRPVAAPGLGTIGVDRRWRVYIDFDKIELDPRANQPAKGKWSKFEFSAVLLHEANHVLRDHANRGDLHGVGLPDRLAWNIAGDACINDDLDECLAGSNLALPADGIRSASLGLDPGQTTEWYYDKIKGQFAPPPCPACEAEQQSGNDTGDNSPGSGSGGASGTANDSHGTPANTDADGDADGDGEAGDAEQGGGGSGGTPSPTTAPSGSGACEHQTGPPAGCGSGGGGKPFPCEIDGDAGDVTDSGVSAHEADLLRRDAAIQIRNHQGGSGQGTVPAGLSRLAEEILAPPKIDWRRHLRASVKSGLSWAAGKVDYTYRRPSKRTQRGGVILPSMQMPKPKVVTVLDTSGSMGSDDIQAALAEIDGICKKAGLRGDDHKITYVDAAASDLQRVNSAKDIVLTGGGGTDMRVGIDLALEERPRPHVVIVMTDGYTPWPDTPPHDCKVIIVIIREGITPEDVVDAGGRAALDLPDWAIATAVDPTDV